MLPILQFSLFNPVLETESFKSFFWFFCGEISAGIDGRTCLLAGRWWRTGTGARTLSWRPEEERRGGLLGRSSLGTHHSDEHPRQVWQRRAADHGTWFVSRVERIFPKCSTHLSICNMRFVALKGAEIVVWEQLSLGGYHGQTENSVCANWKAHFPQL